MTDPLTTLRDTLTAARYDHAPAYHVAIEALAQVETLIHAARALQADSFGDAPAWDALDAALAPFTNNTP